MNDSEPFEQRLRRQPVKQIPEAWRAQILSAARESLSESKAIHSVPSVTRPSSWATLCHQLAGVFWPHPAAWASLAAVWLGILALNLSLSDQARPMVSNASPPTPEVLVELHQQHVFFAELVGNNAVSDTIRPRQSAPKPRSGRSEIIPV